ncbi:MAG: aspartate kinase, partial [Sphingobacteriia bacterium]
KNSNDALESNMNKNRELLAQLGTKEKALAAEQDRLNKLKSELESNTKRLNELESLCDGIFLLGELSPRIKDRLVSYGEILSSYIISSKLKSLSVSQQWVDARLLITTNDKFGNAAVNFEKTNTDITHYFSKHSFQVYIVPGFIASDADQNTTTLGRGGSDYTGAIFAAALNSSTLEIWTDVSGMMTADPRLVQHVKHIERISYQEAMELSHFGAKIIYPPTIQPVMKKNIPVWIKNTFEPEAKGTIIEEKVFFDNEIIRGISSINSISLLSLEGSGMVGIPGFSKRLFEILAIKNINVILITQSSSEHSICVGISEADASSAQLAIDQAFAFEIETGKVDPVKVETDLSIVALVGEQMKSHPGISGKMFGALGRNGINVRAIAQGSSEKNISAVLSANDVKKAINVLHEIFFETTYKQLNVFIAGAGNVGGKLIGQINQQLAYLKEHLRLQIQVVGIANSKKMLLNDGGIDLSNWKNALDNALPATIDNYVESIVHKNLRNSVFVDVTANATVANA